MSATSSFPGRVAGDIPVLILVLLVDAAHKSGRRGKDLVDEDEDGLLGRQLDSLADDVDELANSQIGGDQVLLLVDGRDVALLDLFANDLFNEFVSSRFLQSLDGRGSGSDVADGTTTQAVTPRMPSPGSRRRVAAEIEAKINAQEET